jgi:hypothetical protein
MKKAIAFLCLIMVVFLCACGSEPITDAVKFDEIQKLSVVMDNGKEVELTEIETKEITDYLSQATIAGKDNDFDGGIQFNAYIDDNLKYTFILGDANHIVVSTNSDVTYKIAQDRYDTINAIANLYQKENSD